MLPDVGCGQRGAKGTRPPEMRFLGLVRLGWCQRHQKGSRMLRHGDPHPAAVAWTTHPRGRREGGRRARQLARPLQSY